MVRGGADEMITSYLGGQLPPNSNSGAVERYYKFHITGTTASIPTKLSTAMQTTDRQVLFMGGPNTRATNP